MGRGHEGVGEQSSGQYGPLLHLLIDPSPAVRIGALETLGGLSLDEQEWIDVAKHVRGVLDGDATAWPERPAVVALAARVPVRSVRERLVSMATGRGGDALAAARSLASVHDARGARVLLEFAEGGDVHAAESLASLDLRDVVNRVRKILGRVPRPPVPEEHGTEEARTALYAAADAGLLRFWLALALARSGDDTELRAFVEDERRGRATNPLFWGQPEVAWARIRAGGPVPDVLLASSSGGEAG